MKDVFLNGLEALCARCNFKASRWDVEAYTTVFDNRWDDGVKALKLAFMRIKPQHGMPSPYDLLSLVGEVSPAAPTSRDRGTEAANQILGAVSKFGSYRAIHAKESLGVDIWRIVEAIGGWEILCSIEIDDLPTWRAQIRDAAEGLSKKDYFGSLQIGSSKQVQDLINGQATAISIQ